MRVLVLVAALLLAGCVEGDPAAGDVALAAASSSGVLDGAMGANASVRWEGAPLQAAREMVPLAGIQRFACGSGVCPAPPPDCDATSCETRVVEVRIPSGWEGDLEASIRWPTIEGLLFELRVETPDGKRLVASPTTFIGKTGQTLVVPDPVAGPYAVTAFAVYGEGPYEAILQLEPRVARPPDAELLPDLIPLPPTDLSVETPRYSGVGYVQGPLPLVREATMLAGAPGCKAEEIAERGAKRCLRFSTAVGNVGEGPLDVWLAPGPQAKFVQRIMKADGSYREAPGGTAEWHATHAHWHNAAANEHVVYAYDESSGVRGEEVARGKKAGICYADIGLVDLGLPRAAPSAYDGLGCVAPVQERTWSMGLAQNWYDLYPSHLGDQYVDITGVPDGVYTLCALANAGDTLVEADFTNNESCTPFRLTGNAVETLSEEPYHKAVDPS